MSPINFRPLRFAIVLLISALLVSACSGSSDSQTPAASEEIGANNVLIAGTNSLEDDTVELEEPQASLELVADKTFRISWQPSKGAQFYRVLENPDGVSGFSQISDDLDASKQELDHRVALYKRMNASYIVQACNSDSCVESEEQIVVGTLEPAIGYFKASNSDGYFRTYNSNFGDEFGNAISLSADGNTLAIGANEERSAATGINGNQNDNSVLGAGAVYVFARIDGNWQQQAYLKSSNTSRRDYFGYAVSLSADGETLAVGATGEDGAATGINGDQSYPPSASDSGAVYIYARNDGDWQQQAYVKASNNGEHGSFGIAVSLSADGETLAVGAVYESSSATGINGNQDDNSVHAAGAVYIFVRDSGNWQQQAYVKASNTDVSDFFGVAVSLSADGETLAVGATGEGSAATGINGNQNNNSVFGAGAVYVFGSTDGNWQQQAYVKASNTNRSDEFGNAVSLSADGETLAVGATNEDSAATGINGNQDDNSTRGTGAVYVFTRSDGNWQQQAYVKASNTGRSDDFGQAISISADGNTLAVGARYEGGAATGINGSQDDNSAGSAGAGAVYVFLRSDGNWQQLAYVKASNTDLGYDIIGELGPLAGFHRESAQFGEAVDLSADGETLAVGAINEDSAATGINGNQDDESAPGAGAVYLY